MKFAPGEVVIAKFDDHEGLAKVLEVSGFQVKVAEESTHEEHWLPESHLKAPT